MVTVKDDGGTRLWPDGYCYMQLFNDAHVSDVYKIGPKPTVAEMRRYIAAHVDCLSDKLFTLSLGVDSGGTIGHVSEASDGCGISSFELIKACAKALRIGSNGEISVIRNATRDEVVSGNPVTMEVRPGRPVHTIQLPIGGYLNQDNNYMVLDPKAIKGLYRTYGLFESVRLDEFSITVTVQGDISTVARIAATASKFPPVNNGGWATAEASMTVTGNQQGATISEFTLPSNHQFGRELKGVAISNQPPIFHFYVTSLVPCHVWYRGHFRLSLSGQGNPVGVDLSSTVGKMSVLYPRAVISVGDGQGLVPDDSDDDDEDVPETAVLAVQPRQTTSGSSSGGSPRSRPPPPRQ